LKGEERLRSTATVQENTLPLGGSEAQEVWTLGYLGQEGVIAAQQGQLRGLAGLPRELCQKWPADLRTDLIVPDIVVCATWFLRAGRAKTKLVVQRILCAGLPTSVIKGTRDRT